MKRILILALVLSVISGCSVTQKSVKVKPVEIKQAVALEGFIEREILIEKRYLNIPIKEKIHKEDRKSAMLLVAGEIVQEFAIGYGAEEVTWWAFIDMSDYMGKKVTFRLEVDEGVSADVLDKIDQTDKIKGWKTLYKEKMRPQFHFTSKRGWNNDSNGLVYYKGLWHLFYQHNPFSIQWGNMHWGHAVSSDLVHWKELGDAIYPDELGPIYSGSAVVDWKNIAGFQKGKEKTIVCFYTSAGGKSVWSEGKEFTQSIAYSTDGGKRFTTYENNPVIGHIAGNNRDPKVFWHEATGKWVMVLFIDRPTLGFFTSDDLKDWELVSKIDGFHECPELFELAVDGDETDKKWVLYGANGKYFVGEFDGEKFVPDGEIIRYSYGDCFYASQTWNDVPAEDGRRVQIGWAPVTLPDMPFNQMINFPVELTLHTTDEGVQMFAMPVREIEKLRGKKYSWKNEKLIDGENLLEDVEGEFFDIKAEIEVGDADFVGLNVRGVDVVYDVKKNLLVGYKKKRAPLKLVDGKIRLRVLCDRGIREVFANDGRIYMPLGKFKETGNKNLEIFATGGDAKVTKLDVYELESIW